MSEHFTLAELTVTEVGARKGIPNFPNSLERENLERLAEFLEEVRAAVGDRPVVVNSAFRCKAVNDAIGGRPNSQHLSGCAADLRVPGLTPDQVVKKIRAAGLPYDQLIREFDTWTHVSITNAPQTKPRGQVLVIDSRGARPYAAA